MRLNQRGVSVLEIILAVTMFVIFATGAMVVVVQGYNANRLGVEYTVANQFASEGIEAVRSIKNQDQSSIFTNPIGYWAMDEGFGLVANDSSGNNLTGNLTNGPTWTSHSGYGNAVNFDGNNDFVAVPANTNLNSASFSIGGWFYPTSLRVQGLITKNNYANSWRLFMNNTGGRLEFDAKSDTVNLVSSATLPLNTWTHVMVTFDATNNLMKIYLNGNLDNQVVAPGDIGGANNSDIIIGAVNNNPDFPFIGQIDEIKMYNYVRTPQQILNDVTSGVTRSASNVWVFDGVSDTFDNAKYTRTVSISDVKRDGSGNIASTGTSDSNTKKVTSTVIWNFNSARPESVSLTTYLTYWEKALVSDRNGLLVYGDGGTSSDAIRYKIFDGSNGTWGSANLAGDVDAGTTNRALRAAKLYSSSTRNEKILISRHYNGTTQYIYAQVFNGSTWTTPQLLSSWNATTFLDVKNFDGTYLSNGNFLAVFSDNTTIPKSRVWNGTSWLTQSNTVNIGGIPTYIVLRARSSTNEVMLAAFDQGSDTNTAYFNGSAWSSVTEHSTAAPTTTKEHVDFAWSPHNSLKGVLIYSLASNDNTQNLRVWTANGSGSGSWSATVEAPNAGGRLGTVDVDGRKGAESFVSCQKNANNKVGCFVATTAPGWSTPTNTTLTNNTETGIQRSYNFAFEDSGDEGIVVYSDNSSTPQLKVYSSNANSFDANPLALNTLGSVLSSVRLRPSPISNDIIILLGANNTVYSLFWNGTSNSIYTSPVGKDFTTHGSNGSSSVDFWYDFVWDRF